MRNHKRTLVLSMLCGLLAAPTVNAQENCEYRSATSGSWVNDANWDCYSVRLEGWYPCDDEMNLNDGDEPCLLDPPDGTRKATIRAGHVVHVAGSTQAVRVLVIEDDATTPGELQLRLSSTTTSLTINDGLDMETGTNDGRIAFANGSGGTPELIIDGDDITAAGDIAGSVNGGITVNGTGFTVSGSLSVTAGTLTVDGGVVLSGSSATSLSGGALTLNDSVVLNSSGTVSVTAGTLTFNGSFENDGALSITGSSEADVVFNAAIASGSSGDWTIDNPNGTLRVSAASTVTDSNGTITLEDGTLDVDATFQFNGKMDWTRTGIIDVANTKQFVAASGDL